MGETTGIAWTDSTINVWHGCTKVSDGCKHCYAEQSTPVRVKRAAGLEVWGANAARSETKGWEASLRKWNRQAAATAHSSRSPVVHRVFGQSLSDTFEDYDGVGKRGGGVERADGSLDGSLDTLRARFFAAIERCPALTFQLLTKRPENILRMAPPAWLTCWPAHVWIGATVEDQANADERIPHLLRVPAAVRFLSVEPQVGPVQIRPDFGSANGRPISWVIQGGESGSKARPFDLAWARSLRDQCRAAGVPFFLKQLGARPVGVSALCGSPNMMVEPLRDSHGADESEWPEDLRGRRAFPEPAGAR